MNKIYKCLFVFVILLLSMGVACASDNITTNNETSILSVDDNAGAVLDDTLSVESNDISEDLLGSADESALGDSSDEQDYEIITSNVTKYDFRDNYKIKIVNGTGVAVYGGKVDFYVNNELVTTSTVSYSGFASFNLNSYITSSGTYNIVSMYTGIGESGNALARQSIIVDNVPMNERDVQIQFENIKLYDLGEKYSVRVVDKQGNPVRKGNVIFVAYDTIAFCNISESGIASFYLPSDMNFTGNLLLWSMYTDGELYDLAVHEQISIGTRTLVALDKNTIGSRMFKNWNNYTFDYYNGTYVAEIEDNVYMVLALNGNCYLMYENTINNSAQLTSQFRSLASSSKYDVVKLNLLEDTTYTLSEKIWEDQEWYFASRMAYGQLIVNGNGATIKRADDADSLLNFMYIGREANVNFVKVTLTNFNHVFYNHGNLLCQRCYFKDNHAYKLDVELSGSGAVIHNYNTAVFDMCEFRGNTAEYWGWVTQEMDGSILYAEPYSLNIFNGVYGNYRKNSFYGCNFSTTLIYDVDTDVIKNFLDMSEFDENSYFATVNRTLYNVDNKTMVFQVNDKQDLFSVFKMLNTFITANNVVINLAPGTYEFSTGDYNNIRGYNFRHMQQEDSGGYNPVEERYLLDVGYCPVTINGNDAKIKISGNDESDDYHFAYIGKFGLLTLNDVTIEGFNTALFVTGRVVANHTYFMNNIIDHTTVEGDYGGAFRSHGGTVICHYTTFSGNEGDNYGDYSTDDFYADMGSYIELKGCTWPSGYMAGNSYLKGDTNSMRNVNGATYKEKAFESNFETVDFAFFNVSDTSSYNKLRNYLGNHTVTSLYINFTGDYNFELHPVFDRSMAIVFNSNGHNVKLSRMNIESPSTMTFIGFNFNNIKIENKGSVTFINCTFFNNKDAGDYFFTNSGSCTLINCDFHDNKGDDSIIYNTGSLTIYDGSFKNNEFDDDYGIIYNYGGTVTCMNTTFSGNTKGYYIFNFASGNAAYSGSGITSSNVEFDEAWADWKAGLVQGAFLLGTALLTYGAGTAVGALIPGVAGLVVASVAGAGIGAVSGLTYGLIEGSVYHDYSNVWKHVLSYALMGLGMAQSGFAAKSDFIRQVDEAFNPGEAGEGAAPGQGAQAPQNPQNPQGPRDLNALNKDPQFIDDVKVAINGDLDHVGALRQQYPEFVNHIQNTFNSLSNNVNVNVQELLTLYSTMQTILSRQNVVNPNEAPANIINRVVNNQNNAIVDNVPEPLPENHLLLEEDNILVDNLVHQTSYLERRIQDTPNIQYLSNMLNVVTLQFADINQTHVDRVLDLLSNLRVLYNRAYRFGFSQLSENMRYYMNLYDNTIGRFGNSHAVNSLFNFHNVATLSMWERVYASASYELDRLINNLDLREFNLDGQTNLTTQIESRISNLIQQLDNRFENDPDNRDKFETLKELYKNNNHNDFNVMMRIIRELSELTKIPKINVNDYNAAMAYDYNDLIRNNIYYSVFNRPNAFKNINDVSRMSDDVKANLNLLREIDVTLYKDIMQSVFSNKTDFKQWADAISDLKQRNGAEAAMREMYNTYKQAYEYLELFGYRDNSAINEEAINTYYVKNLFKNYLNVYSGLSNSNKLFLNKYFYDKCSELMKTYNGLRYYIGLMDQTDNFKEVSNVSDTSNRYFEKLTKLYTILIASNGNDNLFNKNITGLPSAQIGDMIIEDLVAYYNINYLSLLISRDFIGSDPDFYLLGKIINWAKSDSIDNLTSFYNSMSAIRAELHAVYTIEKQIYFLQPIDPDYYQNNIRTIIVNRNWISTEIQDETSKLFSYTNVLDYFSHNKDFVIKWFVDNQEYPGVGDPEDVKMFLRTIMFIDCYNLYLEDSNIPKTKNTLIEMLLAEASSKYPVNLVFDGEYLSLINLNLNMDLEDIKDAQRDLDPKETRFNHIDVAELSQKLDLLKTASPVAYWLLMQKVQDKYDYPMISETNWEFDKKLGQFCIEDVNGQKVTYYDFVTSVVDSINEILPALGVIDGNSIRFKSMNYKITRLVDNGNKYNNVFNKYAYYNQMPLTPENVQMMIKDMEYDLNYLRDLNDNEDVYDYIIDYLFEGQVFSDWIVDKDGEDLLIAYNGIFDALGDGGYRNNSKVLENEINVLINQLNNNTIKGFSNNNLTTQIRSNLLYFISFWEFLHRNTDESDIIGDGEIGDPMSTGLINAPLQEIFNRYSEIVRTMIVHSVFSDKTDLNSLSLEEMKNLFNNNLYRAYHNPTRYAQAFEVLNDYDEDLKSFTDFRAYEDYINSINDKQVLIELYNSIRSKINPSSGNADVKPNPSEDSALSKDVLNDIKKILFSDNIYDDEKLYTSDSQAYFMGSWKAFANKYPELSGIVLKDLMKGDLDKFIVDNKRDYDAIRLMIINFLKTYAPANNQPAQGNVEPAQDNSIVSKSQFEEIKKIMENCDIEPSKQYNVIGNDATMLYGSWEKIVEKYPDVAKKVAESLFNSNDVWGYDGLDTYLGEYGSKDNCKVIRQNIIEFIRKNCYKENVPEIVDKDGAVDKDVILINGKTVSESTVDEVYQYTVNKIKFSQNMDPVMKKLLNEADSIFTGYLQYVDLMKSAGISENEYSKGFDQFKNRLLNILKEGEVSSQTQQNFWHNIDYILTSKHFLPVDFTNEISTTDIEYQLALGSWMKLEHDYPDMAKSIMEEHFQNNMDNFKAIFDESGRVGIIKALYAYIDTYVYENQKIPTSSQASSSSQGSSSNPIVEKEPVLIEKESLEGATLDQIIAKMQNAVKKADEYIEKIRVNDPELADSLKNKVNSLYDEHLVLVKSYSHQYRYIVFMDELNKLFEDVAILISVNDNAQASKYHIQKENITILGPTKAKELIQKTMTTVKSNVDDIMKTNKKLGQWISDKASELLSKYNDSILKGDINSYNQFINELNKLFVSSIGFSSSDEIDEEALRIMSNEDIKNLIRMKVHLNQDLKISQVILGKLNQPNLTKQDLIVIHNTLDSYITKESILKDKNKILTKGNIFFGLKDKYFSDINRVKRSLESNLRSIQTFFPDLHQTISLLFKDYIGRLSELPLNESVALYNDIKAYTIGYFNLFKNPQDFQEEMKSRNIMEDMLHEAELSWLNEITFNFFDSTPIYFLRNLDTSDAETIKNVIQDEMQSMSTHDHGLYSYCLNKYFNGASSPEAFFESLKDTIPPEKADKYFHDLYKNIHNEFNSMRNLLEAISKLKTDTAKKNAYIESFEKAHNVDLSSDAAKFTRTLVIALMNLQSHNKYNLTNMLIQGLNKDGSLNEDVKKELLDKICDEFYLADDDITLKEEDLEMLVDIMTSNFPQSFKIQVMADYLKLTADVGGAFLIGTKDTARYQLILSLILRNKLLFDSENVILYPDELNLLNALSVLKCYKLMSDILQLKLKGEFSNKDTVKEGLIPGLDDIRNSIEYKLLYKLETSPGDEHINSYYTVFNQPCPKILDYLVHLIDDELEKLGQFDVNLQLNIMNMYFGGYTLEEIQSQQIELSHERLTEIYAEIVEMLNFWRNKDISEAAAKL